MSCWYRCSKWFSSDEQVADVVMRVMVLLVARYLGPRGFPMIGASPYLKRVYFRIPGTTFLDSPTVTDVVMGIFLNALDGRIR